MNISTIIILTVFAVGGLILWLAYRKGRKDKEREVFLKSAEEIAVASQKVAAEARRTAREIEKFGPDTPVADGNKLLFGKGDDGPR